MHCRPKWTSGSTAAVTEEPTFDRGDVADSLADPSASAAAL